MRISKYWAVFICCALFVFFCAVQAAHAATLTVTKTADTNDGVCDADCSLREAVAVAAPNDTVQFSALFNSPQTITLGGTHITINKNLTINGPGEILLTLDANNQSRTFRITSNVTVVINDLKITGGGNVSTGAAVENEGNLTLNRVNISGNSAAGHSAYGGAIFNLGTVTINDSTLSGNRSQASSNNGGGGAIYNDINKTVNVNRSTFALNSAYSEGSVYGGGAIQNSGFLTVTASTFSGNRGDGSGSTGGAICNLGRASFTNSTFSGNVAAANGGAIYSVIFYNFLTTLTNVTVAGNSASNGGGIYIDNSTTVRPQNSIIANNSASIAPDVRGFVVSDGNNLIGNSAGSTNWDASDILNTNPQLTPLGNYGGTTQTFNLMPLSPAIDRSGITVFPTTDQRGVARPQGSAPDIGAVEYNTVTIQPPSLPAIDAFTFFSQQFSVPNVTVNSYIVSSGALPPGVTLSPSGLLSGLPSAKGTFNFTISALDVNNTPLAETPYTWIINGLNNILITTNASFGAGSLPAAMFVANPNAQITFSPALDGQTLNLSAGEMVITDNLTIDASNLLNGFTVSAGNQSRIFRIAPFVSATITNLKMRDGTVGNTFSGGAVYVDSGSTLNMLYCSVSNSSAGFGGGVNNFGTLNLTNSVVSNNTSNGSGGGIVNNSSSVVNVLNSVISNNQSGNAGGGLVNFFGGQSFVSNSTFSGNVAQYGGAIANFSLLSFFGSTAVGNHGQIHGGAFSNNTMAVTHVANSTFSGNSAGNISSGEGGGFYNDGTTNIVNSTIAFNSAYSGGGIRKNSGTTRLYNTIVANNTAYSTPLYSDIYGFIDTATYNLIGKVSGSDGITAADNNIFGTISSPLDPRLKPLANNGGFTSTHLLTFSSPAVNAGNNANAVDMYNNQPLTIEQRGGARILEGTVDIGAVEIRSRVLNADDSGEGSLRQFIAEAFSGDTIPFDPTFFNQPRTINLTGGEILINKNLTLNAPNGLTIDAGLQNRIFHISVNGTLNLSNITLTRGNSLVGGAVLNFGTFNLSNSSVTNSQATTGGGLANGQTMNIVNSTISGNTAQDSGGISNGGNNGTLTMINSTVSGNTATGFGGGGLNNYIGIIDLTNVTVAFNTTAGAGGGILSQSGGTVQLCNTLISNNNATATGKDVWGIFTSNGYNLVRIFDITEAGGFGANDILGTLTTPVNAGLRPLGINGGTTATHSIASNSAAVNAADPINVISTDQRGISRPRGGRADIGALELAVFVANNNLSGTESLQEALANASDGDTIFFDPAFFSTPRTINLAGGTLTIGKAVTIQGPGADKLTISGNNQNRVIGIAPSLTQVTIKDLTVANGGNVADGAGIFTSSRLNLENVVLTNNTAGFRGGAIFNNYQTVNLLDTTVSNNTANFGGGIYVLNVGSGTPALTGIINIRQSTVSGNTGNLSGKALENFEGTTRIINSTFSGNQGSGSAVINHNSNQPFALINSTVAANIGNGTTVVFSGSTQSVINNSIIAGNTGGDFDVILGFGSSGSNNIIGNGDNSIFTNGVNGNIVGTTANQVNPMLGSLANNGGPTQTHALQPNSPAKNAGNNSLAVDAETGQPLITDQRGQPRIVDGLISANVDIGAFEIQAPLAALASISGKVSTADGKGIRNARVMLTDSNGTSRIVTTSTFGYFRFDDLTVGETYILQVSSKRFIFQNQTQIINLTEDLTDIVFVAEPF